jgi:hypothetical protein
MAAGSSAGVRGGVEALAFGTTETLHIPRNPEKPRAPVSGASSLCARVEIRLLRRIVARFESFPRNQRASKSF